MPIASGAQLVKIDKGFSEFASLGLVEADPVEGIRRAGDRLLAGVAGVCQRLGRGQAGSPDTIAKSLAIGNPADGPYVLDVVRRTGGSVADVSDEEVVDSIQLLARTQGIFAETAGGVTVGVLRKLLAAGSSTRTRRR